jgi:hypothetical protein
VVLMYELDMTLTLRYDAVCVTFAISRIAPSLRAAPLYHRDHSIISFTAIAELFDIEYAVQL